MSHHDAPRHQYISIALCSDSCDNNDTYCCFLMIDTRLQFIKQCILLPSSDESSTTATIFVHRGGVPYKKYHLETEDSLII